ncbi:MAG: signal peptidase II [Eubacteriales bacterium]|nr:signal peptidase II [Eubacteriales bacterium]
MYTLVLWILLDQGTKVLAQKYLTEGLTLYLIPDVFGLCYLKNYGAAWGMLKHMTWLFVLSAIVFAAAILYIYYFRIPKEKHYQGLRILLTLLLAGAIGNAIDRVFRGFVVDFFYFSLIDFPVFNVADCLITVPIALILIFYRKEVSAWLK